MKCVLILFVSLLLLANVCLGQSTTPPPPFIKLAWNLSPTDPTNVAGYNLYFGPLSNNYTNHVFIPGALTSTGTVSNLAWGSVYFFNITTVGTNVWAGTESVFNGETSGSTPPPPPAPPTALRIITTSN